MKTAWLHHRSQQQLVVFCCGWGMDERPFRSLAADDLDILLLYDFRKTGDSQEVFQWVESYRQRILIGWSMGVWGGQLLFGRRPGLFSRTVAINGTLCPVDTRFGISPELFAGTMRGWSERSREKFYQRMCGSTQVLEGFLREPPRRTLDDQQNELAHYLENASCLDRSESIYHEVVVSSGDRIVPVASQLAYWQLAVANLDGPHFPFYRWRTWNQLLDEVPAKITLSRQQPIPEGSPPSP